MSESWTSQDEEKLKELRRRKARQIRDKNRKRKFSPRKRIVEEETGKVKKNE